MTAAAATETRTSEQGRTLSNATVQSFILAALSHEALLDDVDDLLFSHVVEGRLHPSVVTESLKPMIDDVLGAATAEDWVAVNLRLTADAHETLEIAACAPEC